MVRLPVSGLLLAVWLVVGPGAGVGGESVEPPAPPPTGWIEVVPLGLDAPPSSIRFEWRGEPVRLPGPTSGIALVCSGGADVALSCEKRELSAQATATPSVAPGARLRARVVADREPVQGAAIQVFPADLDARRPYFLPLAWSDGREQPTRRVFSDSEGRLELPPLAPGRYRLEVTAPWGRREVGAVIEVPEAELLRNRAPTDEMGRPVLDIGELSLPRGLRVEFHVTDSGGRGLADAVVGGSQHPAAGEGPSVALLGRTDAAGRATLSGAEPALPFRARCSAPGHGSVDLDYRSPPDLVDCRLPAFAAVSGSAVADGEAAPGTVVELASVRPLPTGRPASWRFGTDSSGEFARGELPAGLYRLTASAPGFATESVEIDLAPGEEKILPPLELTPAPQVFGRVVDAASGEPVVGAEVTALEPPGAVATRSDEAGEIVFHHAAGETLWLQVRAAGYPSQTLAVPLDFGSEPDEALKIELPRGGRLRVAVWDEEAEAPCAGCPVVAYRPALPGAPEEPMSSLVTDSDGRAMSDLLPPGTYQVVPERVHSVGSQVEVRSGDEQQSAEVVANTVTEVIFGRPGRSLEVRFWPPPRGFRLLADGPRGRRVVEADPDGVFRLHRRAGEPWILRLAAPGLTVYQAMVPAELTATELELRLPQTRVSGRLMRGDLTVGPLEVRLRSSVRPGVGAWTISGDDGLFQVSHLPADSYLLEVGGAVVAVVDLGEDSDVELGEVHLPGSAAGAVGDR